MKSKKHEQESARMGNSMNRKQRFRFLQPSFETTKTQKMFCIYFYFVL